LFATQVASRRLSGDGGVVTVEPDAHAADVAEVSAVVETVSVVAADAGTTQTHRATTTAARTAGCDVRPATRMLSMTVLARESE
jgi:hypothetical protein